MANVGTYPLKAAFPRWVASRGGLGRSDGRLLPAVSGTRPGEQIAGPAAPSRVKWTPQYQVNGWWVFESHWNPGKCIDIRDGTTSRAVQLWNCSFAYNQQWTNGVPVGLVVPPIGTAVHHSAGGLRCDGGGWAGGVGAVRVHQAACATVRRHEADIRSGGFLWRARRSGGAPVTVADNPTNWHPNGPPIRPRKWYQQPALWVAVVGGIVVWGGAAASGSPEPASVTATSGGDAEALTECRNRVADELSTTAEWADEDVTNRGGGEYFVKGTVDGDLYTCVITRSGDAWQIPDNVIVFSDSQAAAPATTEAPTTTAPPTTTTTVPTTTTTTVPPTTTTTAPSEDPQVANARRSARSYIDLMGFSRQGLIDQLEYEQYPVEAATAAVDSMAIDWNAEAVEKAQSYLDMMGFSHGGLVDQLIYEGFTPEQAEHGASVAIGGGA